jgi:hypothetical protein
MSYYARVFCTTDTVPTIRAVLAWLREEAGYEAEVPDESPAALDSPKWKSFELVYDPAKESLLVECQRNTGKRSLCHQTAGAELDSLENDVPDSDARQQVADCLQRTRFMVYCEVSADHNHEEVANFGALLDYFVDHCGGLIDIEDEGFYAHSDTPLLGSCVERTVKHRRQKPKTRRPARSRPAVRRPTRGVDQQADSGVLATLRRHGTGWRGVLPTTYGTFFGHPVGIDIETRSTRGGPPPAVSQEERDLAKTIIAGLPEVLRIAEKRFADYTASHEPLAHERVREPHVWILRDDFADYPGLGRWTFVVGRSDLPHYAYHLVFDGLEFVEIWAGD